MMEAGSDQISKMKVVDSEQGRCWVGFLRCKDEEGGVGRCRWSRLAGEVAMALLYVGGGEQAREWVASEEVFIERATGEEGTGAGLEALEATFAKEIWWGEVKSNGLCELIRRFG